MDVFDMYFEWYIDNMTPEEARQKREYNLKKFGLSKEEIDRVVIPVLKEKETTEVFDKKTNQQLPSIIYY